MDMVTGLAFALAAGLTLGGIAALTIEIVVGSPVGFTRPYVDHHRIVRSLALTAIVGPYMLLADALIARRESRISAVTLAGCGLTAIVWAGCAGIVLLWLAGAVPGSLGSG